MTATPQNPGSYEQEIDKSQILFNHISQSSAEFPSINWPGVPSGFVFLVLHLFQNIIFNKVWLIFKNLNELLWKGQAINFEAEGK